LSPTSVISTVTNWVEGNLKGR